MGDVEDEAEVEGHVEVFRGLPRPARQPCAFLGS
jgi:hypothetical protein